MEKEISIENGATKEQFIWGQINDELMSHDVNWLGLGQVPLQLNLNSIPPTILLLGIEPNLGAVTRLNQVVAAASNFYEAYAAERSKESTI